jgi:dolichyl-phosphate-mannose-protein mannosyltransferase
VPPAGGGAAASPSTAPRWSRADTVLLLTIVALAAALRLWSIGIPDRIVFDESFYAQDACTLVESPEVCDQERPITEEHPFLAKWLIAAGISIFGYEAWAWRLIPVLFGVAGVGLTYVLARRLLASTWFAAVTALLLTFDFLHFAMSRVAMLDIFVATFALAGVLFAVLDRDRPLRPIGAERLRDRKWLLATGAALGAAFASKWSGAFFLAAVSVAVVVWDAERRSRAQADGGWWRTVRSEWVVLGVALVVLPAVIYVASFGNRFDGTLLALPWDRDSWWWDLARRQVVMFRRHIDLHGLYPYTSPAWSWPLVKRPFLLVFEAHGDVTVETLGFGNPVVWWPAVVSMALTALRWLRGPRGITRPEGVILLGFAAGYLVWVPLTISRPFSFLFYLLPAVPFMLLALTRAIQLLPGAALPRAVSGVLVAVVIALFGFFYPLLTARPLPPDQFLARMWFRDCLPEQMATYPPRPPSEPTRAPEGWCWI